MAALLEELIPPHRGSHVQLEQLLQFQYTWILPGLFGPQVNLRQHCYFGGPLKDNAHLLFDFWSNARSGRGAELQRYCDLGFLSQSVVRTPLAAYHNLRKPYNAAGSPRS
jgi:hypothetical protein